VFIYILSNKNEVTFSPATVSNVPLSPQSVQQRKKIESFDLHRQDEEETVDKSLTFIDFLFFPPCLRHSSRVPLCAFLPGQSGKSNVNHHLPP
jgi:hypothetical protein